MAPPFSSPQGNAPQTLAALWCLVALALVFVLLRLYTRYKVIDAIGIDDHLFNVSFVSKPDIRGDVSRYAAKFANIHPLSGIGPAGRVLYLDHSFRLLRLWLNSRRCA